jgi:hypothetical protein
MNIVDLLAVLPFYVSLFLAPPTTPVLPLSYDEFSASTESSAGFVRQKGGEEDAIFCQINDNIFLTLFCLTNPAQVRFLLVLRYLLNNILHNYEGIF